MRYFVYFRKYIAGGKRPRGPIPLVTRAKKPRQRSTIPAIGSLNLISPLLKHPGDADRTGIVRNLSGNKKRVSTDQLKPA